MSYKVSVVSLGCPKNQVDAEAILSYLQKAGFEISSSEAQADAIIINTCGFIEDAKREAIENISPGEKIYFRILKLTVNPLEHPQLEQIFVVSFRTKTTDIITIESYKNTEKQSLNKIKSTCVVMASILFCVAIVNVVISIKKSKQISQ